MTPPNVSYEWVASHQDDKKAWHELSLEEKLNTECDMLAKEAFENSLHQPTRKQKEQLLPLEPASLNVEGVKKQVIWLRWQEELWNARTQKDS